MPPPSSLSPSAGALQGTDAFLHLQVKRAGKIKGEAVAPGHEDDITVVGWSWGVEASQVVGSTRVSSRRSYTPLTIVKGVDAATTGLMSAMTTNDEIKEARLTMRRAGGEQEVFLVITLRAGRVVGVSHDADASGGVAETVRLSFTKVDVEYRSQQTRGTRGASSLFTDELDNTGI